MVATKLADAALELGARGLRVFPCIERGKEPAIVKNLERATTDPNTIIGWWRSREFNIGLATGEGSGVWVLDIDGEEGEATLKQLEAEHGALPPTIEQITGKGRHLFFRWVTGLDIRNFQHRDDVPGIDVRGNGGYVLVAPSIHPSGRVYSWSVDSGDEFADAPEWLLDVVKRRRNASAPVDGASAADWRTFIGHDVEGSRRGPAVARFSGLLLRKYVDPMVVVDLARMFNTLRCQPPLEDSEVVRIVTDIARREENEREARR